MAGQKLRRKRSTGRTIAIVVGIGAAALVSFPLLIAAFGIVLGLVGVVLSLAVTVGPWLALGYLGYRLARRSRPRQQPQPVWTAPTWNPPPAAPVAPPPPQPEADPAGRLPEEQRAQVHRIREKAATLLQQAERFPTGSRNLHLVQRTLDTYLPSTLDSYLRLGPGADEWVVAPDGRTGLHVLRDQLAILESRLDEVTSDLWKTDVQRLLANERFLEEHFGKAQPDELTIR